MKRIFSYLLVLIMIFNLGSVTSFGTENDSDIAEAVLGKSVKITGFKAVEPGTKTTPTVVVRDNSECWLLDNQSGTQSAYINFILAENFKHKQQDGSVYEISVEYYDTGKGYFAFRYNSLDKDKQLGDIIYMQDEKMWKTVKFTVDDAGFEEKLDGKFDFSLSIKATSSTTSGGTSSSAIGIRKVTVEKKENVNPVWVSSSNDREGNAYEWFSENKIIKNKFSNLTDEQKEVTVTHRFINENKYVAYEKSEDMTFLPGEVKEVDFDFSDFKRCDVYDYYIDIKAKDASIDSHIYTMTLAILKTDPDGICDERIQYSAHFSHTSDRLAHKAMWEILKLGNINTIRASADWQSTEPTRGSLGYTESIKLINSDIRENGFKRAPGGFFYSPKWVSGGLTLPKGEDELQAWERFIRFAIEEQKDNCDRYEIWNEPNITSFNKLLDERGPDVYMEAFKVAAKVIQEVDPGALVGGPSTTGIQYASGYNFWKGCLENGFAEIENAAIVLHPYTTKPIEISGIIEDVLKHKQDFINAGGREDVEIWHTEVGYTLPDEVVGTERMKGALNTRSAISYFTNKAGDILNFYNLEKKGYVGTDREDMFGSVGYKGVPQKKYEKRCIPTAAYVQMTGLTYLLANAQIDKHFVSENGNVYTSVFNSEKFNNKIMTLHTINEAENVTIDLGTDVVRLFDEYGNETEVYGNNGIFTFTVDNYPKYVMGDIKKSEVLENNILLDYSTAEIIAAETDIFPIEITNYTDKAYTLEIEVPESVRIIENNGFKDKKAVVYLENLCSMGEEAFCIISVKDGERMVSQSKQILYSENLMSTGLSVSLDDIKDSNRWSGTLKIKNHSATKTLTGKAKFISDDLFSKVKPMNIGIIPPGMTGLVEFSLPNVTRKGQYYPQYEIELNNGLSYEFMDSAEFTLAKYAYTKPVIDGDIKDGEWAMDTAMYADNPEQVSTGLKDWTVEDISGKSVVMWDEENYYMCAVITDDKHVNNRPAAENWNGDDMQFGIFYGDKGFVAIGQANTTFHEISMALSSVTNEVTLYRFLSQDSSYPAGEIKDAACAIKRVGNKTYYEFCMPWNKLLRPGDQPKVGDMLGYSFVINEADTDKRDGYIQYASGIASGKDTSLFTYMMLLK